MNKWLQDYRKNKKTLVFIVWDEAITAQYLDHLWLRHKFDVLDLSEVDKFAMYNPEKRETLKPPTQMAEPISLPRLATSLRILLSLSTSQAPIDAELSNSNAGPLFLSGTNATIITDLIVTIVRFMHRAHKDTPKSTPPQPHGTSPTSTLHGQLHQPSSITRSPPTSTSNPAHTLHRFGIPRSRMLAGIAPSSCAAMTTGRFCRPRQNAVTSMSMPASASNNDGSGSVTEIRAYFYAGPYADASFAA